MFEPTVSKDIQHSFSDYPAAKDSLTFIKHDCLARSHSELGLFEFDE